MRQRLGIGEGLVMASIKKPQGRGIAPLRCELSDSTLTVTQAL